MLASLRRQFISATVYPDLQRLKAANPDGIVLIDSHTQLITSRNSDIKTDVIARFYDKAFNYIGTVEGSDAAALPPVWANNKRTDEIISDINEQRKVQTRALQRFDRSLDVFIGNTAEPIGG